MKKLILLLPLLLFSCKSESQKEIERLDAEYQKAKENRIKAQEKHDQAVEELLILKR